MLTYRFILRRGPSEKAAADVPLDGELLLNTSNRTITVGDGMTAGGLTLHKASVGLGNVDNTADTDKPVSTPQAAALSAKAPLASPAFTGAPTAPTPTSAAGIATKQYVDNAVANAAGSAGSTAVSPAGLMHWWPLGDWAPAPQACLVTPADVLTPTAPPTLAFGPTKAKRSLQFSGSQYLTRVSDSSLQLGTGSFSMLVSVCLPAATNRQLVGKWDYGENRSEWALDYASDRIRFRLKSADYSTSQTYNSAAALTPNLWHTVAVVFDVSAATLKLYVDGVLSSSGAVPSGVRNDSSRLVVGAGGITANTVEGYLVGWLADLLLWHRALSAAEVTTLYADGAGPTWPLVSPD